VIRLVREVRARMRYARALSKLTPMLPREAMRAGAAVEFDADETRAILAKIPFDPRPTYVERFCDAARDRRNAARQA